MCNNNGRSSLSPEYSSQNASAYVDECATRTTSNKPTTPSPKFGRIMTNGNPILGIWGKIFAYIHLLWFVSGDLQSSECRWAQILVFRTTSNMYNTPTHRVHHRVSLNSTTFGASGLLAWVVCECDHASRKGMNLMNGNQSFDWHIYYSCLSALFDCFGWQLIFC